MLFKSTHFVILMALMASSFATCQASEPLSAHSFSSTSPTSTPTASKKRLSSQDSRGTDDFVKKTVNNLVAKMWPSNAKRRGAIILMGPIKGLKSFDPSTPSETKNKKGPQGKYAIADNMVAIGYEDHISVIWLHEGELRWFVTWAVFEELTYDRDQLIEKIKEVGEKKPELEKLIAIIDTELPDMPKELL